MTLDEAILHCEEVAEEDFDCQREVMYLLRSKLKGEQE